MIFNTHVRKEKSEAFRYFMKLVNHGQIVEVKRISPNRTLKQNSYLHLILAAFGGHFGYTLEEAKIIYKEVNRGIYTYEKKGRTFYRSSAKLTKDEMMKTIDRFREASAEQGFELPLATDQEWLKEVSNQIEREGLNYYL